MCNFRRNIFQTILIFLIAASMSACSLFTGNLKEGISLIEKKDYEKAITVLDSEIDSARTPQAAAKAYKYRGIAKAELKDYRHAYTDFQIAWKLSCTLAPKYLADDKASTNEEYNDCNSVIPEKLHEIKHFLSDFSAIMATQKAAEIMSKKYPAFAR